jgi:hypothetical protein
MGLSFGLYTGEKKDLLPLPRTLGHTARGLVTTQLRYPKMCAA